MPHSMSYPALAADDNTPDTPDMMTGMSDSDAFMGVALPTATPTSAATFPTLSRSLPVRFPQPVADDDFANPGIPDITLTQAPGTPTVTLTLASGMSGLDLFQQPGLGANLTQQHAAPAMNFALTQVDDEMEGCASTFDVSHVETCKCDGGSLCEYCKQNVADTNAKMIRASVESEDANATVSAFLNATREAEIKRLIAILPRDRAGNVVAMHAERLAQAGYKLEPKGWKVALPCAPFGFIDARPDDKFNDRLNPFVSPGRKSTHLVGNVGIKTEPEQPFCPDSYEKATDKFLAFETVEAFLKERSKAGIRRLLNDHLPRGADNRVKKVFVEILDLAGVHLSARGSMVTFDLKFHHFAPSKKVWAANYGVKANDPKKETEQKQNKGKPSKVQRRKDKLARRKGHGPPFGLTINVDKANAKLPKAIAAAVAYQPSKTQENTKALVMNGTDNIASQHNTQAVVKPGNENTTMHDIPTNGVPLPKETMRRPRASRACRAAAETARRAALAEQAEDLEQQRRAGIKYPLRDCVGAKKSRKMAKKAYKDAGGGQAVPPKQLLEGQEPVTPLRANMRVPNALLRSLGNFSI